MINTEYRAGPPSTHTRSHARVHIILRTRKFSTQHSRQLGLSTCAFTHSLVSPPPPCSPVARNLKPPLLLQTSQIPPKALAAMKKTMGGGSVSSDKVRTVLRGVQMIKAKVQALAAIVDAAMEKIKGVVAGVLDQGKTRLLGALDQGKAKFNEVGGWSSEAC